MESYCGNCKYSQLVDGYGPIDDTYYCNYFRRLEDQFYSGLNELPDWIFGYYPYRDGEVILLGNVAGLNCKAFVKA